MMIDRNVDHPRHYQHPAGVECVEISRHLPHARASAFEYVWRHRSKHGVEDLRKARWWLNDWMAHSTPYILPRQCYLAMERLKDDPDYPALYAIAHECSAQALERVEEMIMDNLRRGVEDALR